MLRPTLMTNADLKATIAACTHILDVTSGTERWTAACGPPWSNWSTSLRRCKPHERPRPRRGRQSRLRAKSARRGPGPPRATGAQLRLCGGMLQLRLRRTRPVGQVPSWSLRTLPSRLSSATPSAHVPLRALPHGLGHSRYRRRMPALRAQSGPASAAASASVAQIAGMTLLRSPAQILNALACPISSPTRLAPNTGTAEQLRDFIKLRPPEAQIVRFSAPGAPVSVASTTTPGPNNSAMPRTVPGATVLASMYRNPAERITDTSRATSVAAWGGHIEITTSDRVTKFASVPASTNPPAVARSRVSAERPVLIHSTS